MAARPLVPPDYPPQTSDPPGPATETENSNTNRKVNTLLSIVQASNTLSPLAAKRDDTAHEFNQDLKMMILMA